MIKTSEQYELFSKFYDKVQKYSKYSEWKAFIEEIWRQQGVIPNSLLDLACGTCNNARLYAKDGIRVTGIDLSKNMLNIAEEKIKKHQLDIKLFNQSFYNIVLADKFDSAICLDFSTAHILRREEFICFLNEVYQQLNIEGIFIFDVKPRIDYERKFAKCSEFTKVNGLKYKWIIKFDEQDHSLVYVTLLAKIKEREFQEQNLIKTYTLEELKEIIAQTNFELIGAYDNYQFTEPKEDSKFWVFALQKNK